MNSFMGIFSIIILSSFSIFTYAHMYLGPYGQPSSGPMATADSVSYDGLIMMI